MKFRIAAGSIVALTVVGGVVSYDQAEACTPPPNCPEMRYPIDGATDVPTNTKLWTKYDGTLRLSTGNEPPTELAMAPIMTLPDTLLPNTTYTVTLVSNPDTSYGCETPTTLSFITGSGPDAAPVPPAINDVTTTFQPAQTTNSCGPTDDRFLVEVSISPPFVADAVAHRIYRIENGARVGSGADYMIQASPWFYVDGADVLYHYEIVTVSASGIESSASSFDVTIPEEYRDGSGAGDGAGACSVGGERPNASHLASLWLVAVGVGFALRRRLHPSHQQQ